MLISFKIAKSVVNAKIFRLRCVLLKSIFIKKSRKVILMKLKVKNVIFLVKTL